MVREISQTPGQPGHAVSRVAGQELDTTNLIELAGRRGLMPADFARRIRGMAGMRNVLVHGYLEVDQRLGDFDELGRHALRPMKHGEPRGC